MKKITPCGVAAIVWLAGCAGPGPKLFPGEPVEVKHLSGGVVQRWYDTNGDHRGDKVEEFGADGRLTRIGYAQCCDTVDYVTLSDVPADQQRTLVLLLDSVPYRLVDEAYAAGRFRYCYPPGRTIAPFPVMTDVSFSDFFGSSPSPGVESAFYNGDHLTSGYSTYAEGGNVPWQKYIDYRLHPMLHAEVYIDPYPWLDHELRAMREGFLHSAEPVYIGYSVGASATGAKYAREGHEFTIDHVDRLCQDLLFETRGRARFTLLSDHGHAFFKDGKRVLLADALQGMGYHPGKRLTHPGDVVVPEFGMVSSAVIHTKTPAPVAEHALSVEGVEIAAYMDNQDLVILSKAGKARVTQKGDQFRYKPETGDPLELSAVLENLSRNKKIDQDGFVRDGDLFLASADAAYPDAVQRLWRAFHGLVEHAPDVVVSLDQRYYVADISMTRLLKLVGIHGSLRQESSSGFAMTSAGPLPRVERMPDLRVSLKELGVPIGGAENDQIPRRSRLETKNRIHKD